MKTAMLDQLLLDYLPRLSGGFAALIQDSFEWLSRLPMQFARHCD